MLPDAGASPMALLIISAFVIAGSKRRTWFRGRGRRDAAAVGPPLNNITTAHNMIGQAVIPALCIRRTYRATKASPT
jgi:hypothetical protein